jgi:hypothetical protein
LPTYEFAAGSAAVANKQSLLVIASEARQSKLIRLQENCYFGLLRSGNPLYRPCEPKARQSKKVIHQIMTILDFKSSLE